MSNHLVGLATNLVVAWIAASLAALAIRDRFWYRIAVLAVWATAALNILHILPTLLDFLDAVSLDMGDLHLSLFTLLQGAILLVVLLRLGFWLSGFVERRLASARGLTPSAQVLLGKTIRFSLLALILLVTLNSIGIDLSSLAVVGGAVGVGVGFGLQKVISNLVSGLILLLDKSIKPGDVIQVGDVYGWISRLQARFVSVVTRDGTEYLIPNEDLITGQVINWSFSDQNIRLKIPVGISYESDVELAIRLVKEAAQETSRVLKSPGPVALLAGFGDSSVDLDLRFWINDPKNGIANVRSEVLLKVWHKFKEHGVSIPFPQRDVHLDMADATVAALRGDREGAG